MGKGPHWERPDPPRLNDTATVRTKMAPPPYGVCLRGTKVNNPEALEAPWEPEFTFPNGKRPEMGMHAPFGAGGVVTVRTPYRGRGNPSPDKNRTVPGNGGSLSAAADAIPKGY